MNIYRNLALLNLVCGVILGAGALGMAFALMWSKAELHSVFEIALIAFLAVVAVSVIQPGVAHLKRASEKTALVIAVNTSVLLGFILQQMISISPFKAAIGSWRWILAAGLASYAFQRWLRPAAIQAFASRWVT